MVPDLPLIKRELLQQSQRRRTWSLRALVVIVLSFVFLVPFTVMQIQRGMVGYALLGMGRELVQTVMITLSLLLYLLAPAMTCGAISTERSRQTLPLLLVSRLSPLAIILEKLASHVIPLVVFLLLSVPLLAVSYLFGGISFPEIAAAWLLLVLLAFHLAAIALFWSAALPGSLSAFWATYGTLFLTTFGPLFADGLAATLSPVCEAMFDLLMVPCNLFMDSGEDQKLILFPMYHLTMLIFSSQSIPEVALASVPCVLMTLAFVFAAREALLKSAYGSEISGQKLFHRVLAPIRRRSASQPTAEPADLPQQPDGHADRVSRPVPLLRSIAWRERQRLRVFRKWFAGAAALLLLWQLSGHTGYSQWSQEASAMFIVPVLILVLLAVLSLSTRVFVTEREQQTLDSLLTCPLTTREILRQKLAGVHTAMFWLLVMCLAMGLIRVLWVRFDQSASLFGFGVFQHTNRYYDRPRVPPGSLQWLGKSIDYLLAFLGNTIIYMQIVKWLGLWFGLKSQSQMKAMLGSLLSIFCLCFVPIICLALGMAALDFDPDDFPFFYFCSPIIIVGLNQADSLVDVYRRSGFPFSDTAVILTNLMIYGALYWRLRHAVLRQLNTLLNRNDDDTAPVTNHPNTAEA